MWSLRMCVCVKRIWFFDTTFTNGLIEQNLSTDFSRRTSSDYKFSFYRLDTPFTLKRSKSDVIFMFIVNTTTVVIFKRPIHWRNKRRFWGSVSSPKIYFSLISLIRFLLGLFWIFTNIFNVNIHLMTELETVWTYYWEVYSWKKEWVMEHRSLDFQ